MKPINWNPEKNRKLIEERGISFEDVLYCMKSGGLLDDVSHPNKEQYTYQRIFIVAVDGYAYLVPYVENDEEIFLKTVMPGRKATKQYLGGKKMKDIKLDEEEQEVLEAYESGEYQSAMDPVRKRYIEQLAAETFKKDKRINIRISGRDLAALQRRAQEEGMPYQTLVASVLHKYISGSLYDVTANKRIWTPPASSSDEH